MASQQVESIVVGYEDHASAGANAAANAIKRVGDEAVVTEERVRRASKSGEALGRQFGEVERLTAKVAQITARFARDLQDLEASELAAADKERLRTNILAQQEQAIQKATAAHERWVAGMRAAEAASNAQAAGMAAATASANSWAGALAKIYETAGSANGTINATARTLQALNADFKAGHATLAEWAAAAKGLETSLRGVSAAQKAINENTGISRQNVNTATIGPLRYAVTGAGASSGNTLSLVTGDAEAAARRQHDISAAFAESDVALEQYREELGLVDVAQKRFAAGQAELQALIRRSGIEEAEGARILTAYAQAHDPAIAKEKALAAAYRDLVDHLEPAVKKSRDLAEAQALLDRARDGQIQGVRITADQHAALSLRLKETAGAADETTKSTKLAAWQIANLAQQGQDVFVQLAMGQNPLMILAQQGPQAASAVGGFGRAVELLKSPLVISTSAVALFVAGLGALLAKSASVQGELRQFNVMLKASGDQANVTAAQLKGMARSMVHEGVSRDDADTVLRAAVSARPGLDTGVIQQISDLAPDLATRLGSAAEAGKKMVEWLTGGLPGLRDFVKTTEAFGVAEYEAARAMLEVGNRAGVQQAMLEALKQKFGGLNREGLGPAQQAMRELKNSFDDLVTAAASHPITISVELALAGSFGAIANLIANPTSENLREYFARHVTMGFAGAPSAPANSSGPPAPPEDPAVAAARRDLGAARQRVERLQQVQATTAGANLSAGIQQAQRDVVALEERLAALENRTAAVAQKAPDPATAASNDNAPAGTPIPGRKPLTSEEQIKLSDTARYQKDLAEALKKTGIEGQIARTKLDAYYAALESTKNPTAARLMAEQAETRARMEASHAVAEQTAQYSIQVQGLLGVADAYRQSTAAGIEAAARAQAMTDALSSGVDAAARTRELVIQGAAQQAASSAQAVSALEREVSAQEKVAQASRGGVAARIEAERQAQVAQQTHILLAQAEAAEAQGAVDLALKLRLLAEDYDNLSKRAAKADFGKTLSAYGEQLDAQRRQLDLDGSLIGKPEDVRVVAKAHAQVNELLAARGKTYESLTDEEIKQVDALMAQAEQNARLDQGIRNQQAAWESLGQAFDNGFVRPLESAVDAIVKGQGETVKWRDLAKGALASFAGDLFKLAAWNPLRNMLTGGNAPTLMSLAGGSSASAQPAAANSNGGLNVGSGIGVGSLLTGTPSWTSQPVFGMQAAPSPDFVGPMQPAEGLGGFNPTWGQAFTALGVGLNAFNAFRQFGSGQAVAGTGSLIGAGAGALSLIGVEGTMLAGLAPFLGPAAVLAPIAGMLLQGLLGNQRPSNKEGNASIDWASSSDSITVGGMEGKKYSQENRDAANDLAETMRTLGRAFEGWSDGGKLSTSMKFAVGDRDGIRLDYNGTSKNFDRSEAGIGEMTGEVARIMSAELGGTLPEDIRTAIQNIDWTDLETAMSDLAFAANFQDQLDLLNGSLDPVNNQIKQFTQNAKDIGEQIKTNITDWADTARRLGLATDDELIPAMQNGVLAMMGLGEQVEPLRGVSAVTKQAEINFEQFRPVLVQLGMDVDGLRTQYINNAVTDYNTAVADQTRRGSDIINAALNPDFKVSGANRVANLGFTSDNTPNLVAGLTAFYDAANAGTVTADDLTTALAKLDTNLSAGKITADEYATAVQDIADTYTDSTAVMQKAANDNKTAWAQMASSLVQSWQNVQGALHNAVNANLLGEYSPLSPEERFNEAQRQYRDTLEKAQAGDVKAAESLQAAGEAYLRANDDVSATSNPAVFREVQAGLSSVESVAERQVNYLRSISETITGVEDNTAKIAWLSQNAGRVWSGAGAEQNRPINMELAYRTGYGGNFGSGGWDAWIKTQPEETKAVARDILTSMGQANRITFATGAAFTGQGVYHRPTDLASYQIAEAGPEGVLPLANVGGRLGVLAVMPPANDYTSNLGYAPRADGGWTLVVNELRLLRGDTLRGLSAICEEVRGARAELREVRNELAAAKRELLRQSIKEAVA